MGGKGNDRLWGDAGRDMLSGQDGRDRMDGGTGADIFQLWKASRRATRLFSSQATAV